MMFGIHVHTNGDRLGGGELVTACTYLAPSLTGDAPSPRAPRHKWDGIGRWGGGGHGMGRVVWSHQSGGEFRWGGTSVTR